MGKQTVVCLMGPTASGKTEVAMQLADNFPLDIVSVDSALVYRGMDIGTAKPDADLLRRYPHRLVDIRDPEESYSAGEFVRDASEAIDRIHAAGRVPLLVGGTMMYFRSLIDGLADLPSADADVRREIDAQAAARGWPHMHAQLGMIDSRSADKINPHDAQRIQRALEVYRVSGRALSEWHTDNRTSAYRFAKFALFPEPRVELHRRIAVRLDQMLENGFINEVKLLMENTDLSEKNSAMRAVGYRQYWAFLDGLLSIDQARSEALAATRQLAKRQMTWLRSERNCRCINPLENDPVSAITAVLQQGLFAR